MQLLYVLLALLIILTAIWLFIVWVNWALLPVTLKKELRNIADKIEELKEDKQDDDIARD